EDWDRHSSSLLLSTQLPFFTSSDFFNHEEHEEHEDFLKYYPRGSFQLYFFQMHEIGHIGDDHFIPFQQSLHHFKIVKAGYPDLHRRPDGNVAANHEDVVHPLRICKRAFLDPQDSLSTVSDDQNIYSQVCSQQRTRFLLQSDHES